MGNVLALYWKQAEDDFYTFCERFFDDKTDNQTNLEVVDGVTEALIDLKSDLLMFIEESLIIVFKIIFVKKYSCKADENLAKKTDKGIKIYKTVLNNLTASKVPAALYIYFVNGMRNEPVKIHLQFGFT